MKYLCGLLLAFVCLHAGAQTKLQSPYEFTGFPQGKHFSSYHEVLDYFKYVDEAMANVRLQKYGSTYEGRDLVYAVVTSDDNFSNLEVIRTDNLKRAGLQSGKASTKKAIVWLSFNVHGNEASSTEAAMLTLHSLANPKNATIQQWLKDIVVIIDPCLNPDGRERFVNFHRQFANNPANPNADGIEHREVWPTGRHNHYLFDLNRDWAWATQKETKARLKIYNEWLPHVHVDFHEQYYNEPYYFAPAAEPLHEVITPWQREFQIQIGKNHAKYFDEQGWLYFTKEIYDLYYPSYGDTYPTYNGAIGLTYEQGGLGAGLEIFTDTGEKLTLEDRISHHNTTALSTIEIAARNATKLVDEFEKYFTTSQQNPPAAYKTYVIKGSNDPEKINMLTKWCDDQKITYGHAAASKTTRGFDFQTQMVTNVTVSTEDLIISVHQPKSNFITTVFEPTSKLPDSLTYDITAWNLMYAYSFSGYALYERLTPSRAYVQRIAENGAANKPYAYLFKYNNVQDATLLAALLKEDVRVRCAEKNFTIGNQDYAAGTLIVTRGNNEHVLFFDTLVTSLAKKFERQVQVATTGFVEKGKDFGSSALNVIKAPQVGLLFGPQTSPLSAGEVWHFFEQKLQYPVTLLNTEYFKHVNFAQYNVLIIPEGYYNLFDDSTIEKLGNWVSSGGRLILIANAIKSFADRGIFSVKQYATDDEKNEAEKRSEEIKAKKGLQKFENTERNQLTESISGAIYAVELDNSHPLGFGLREKYFTLKTREARYAWLTHGWNVGTIRDNAKPVQGFAGHEANKTMSKSLVFGVEQKGRGQIVYLVDNPLFRNFWVNGQLIFANAVFMVGQ